MNFFGYLRSCRAGRIPATDVLGYVVYFAVLKRRRASAGTDGCEMGGDYCLVRSPRS
jgi:hypothetical protein